MKLLFLVLMAVASMAHGQNFAVLLARDDPGAPAGFPTNWPTIKQPIGDAKALPPKFAPPWRYATAAQVARWEADHAAEMAAFQAAKEAQEIKPKQDRDAVIRTILGRLRTLKASTGQLTDDQRDKSLREIAAILEAIIEELRP